MVCWCVVRGVASVLFVRGFRVRFVWVGGAGSESSSLLVGFGWSGGVGRGGCLPGSLCWSGRGVALKVWRFVCLRRSRCRLLTRAVQIRCIVDALKMSASWMRLITNLDMIEGDSAVSGMIGARALSIAGSCCLSVL